MARLYSRQTSKVVLNSLCLAAAVLLIAIFSLTASGQTRGWGRNDIGQVGVGNTNSPQPSPAMIGNSGDITAISGGQSHTLFLKADGTVLAAGSNQDGQLGDGTNALARLTPVSVIGLSNVVAVSAGGLHSLALLADGTVMAWGRNLEGQNGGSGPDPALPSPVIGLSSVIAIDAGGSHNLALKADGTVWAWGCPSSGQLGNGVSGGVCTSQTSPTPVQAGVGVPGFNNIIAIAGGVSHSIALKADGTVWVWGSNTSGEIGNGATGGPQSLPVLNTHISGVSRISAGLHFNVVLKPDGTVWAWGFNTRGNIGNGTNQIGATVNVLTPTQTSITDVVDVRTAEVHVIAKKRDGTIWSWGWNQFGQMGNGTIDTTFPNSCQCATAPVQSAVGAGNAVIGIGYDHSFAAIPSVSTAAGSNITLHGDGLKVTFDSVTAAGNTTWSAINPMSTGLDPGNYSVASNSSAYNLATTAAAVGNITVCLQAATVFDQTTFNSLVLLHGEGASLVDRTVSRTYTTKEICSQTTSLSPFVLAQAPTAAAATISGSVTGTNSAPLGGVSLTLTGSGTQVRRTMTDASGNYAFASAEVGSFYTLSPALANYSFSPAILSFSLVGNKTDAVFSGSPGAATANPLDTSEYFVRQQYLDFLGREPDQSGFEYWSAQLRLCGDDAECLRRKRIDVSNAFFFELEFQQTGSYVFRLYRAAFGNNQPFSNPDNSNLTEAKKLPGYDVFAQDRAQVVGGADLTTGQKNLANAFVQRPEFVAKYPASQDGPAFVDAVLATINHDLGADLTSQRTALITLFNSGGRGAVLYRLADDNIQTNSINNRVFIDEEYNRAFVATQYFGYLRRDSDIGGFLFWLGQVNGASVRDVPKQHAMVCAFITSAEYQQRFSPLVTHSNTECQ